MFELGSVTKTMTGLLLADEVQRGRMRLGAPVSDYLPELAGTPAGAATLQQLATHHSGLPELPAGLTQAGLAGLGNANPYQLSVQQLLQLATRTPRKAPGHYLYSNLGMALLGHAEARAAGAVDWPTLARQRILAPLGMTHTQFVTAADQVPAGATTPHHDNGWPAPHWFGAAFTPAGSSTYTTAEDMMAYARGVLQGKVPGLAALQPLADTSNGRIGLAWMTSPVSGRSITWHNGATGGFRSMLALDRGTGQAVLVLNSSTRFVDHPALQLAAAAPGGPLHATDRSKDGYGPLVSLAVGLVLLASGMVSLIRGRHRIAQLLGAVYVLAGLVQLRVHGPWTLAPAELWPALAGLGLAALVLGGLRWPALPVGPQRRRWLSLISLAFAVLVLAAIIWSA